LSIFPNVRYPLADAHRRNSMTGEESRRHRSGLTGRGRRLCLQLSTVSDRPNAHAPLANVDSPTSNARNGPNTHYFSA
jgi:hypothetical protein